MTGGCQLLLRKSKIIYIHKLAQTDKTPNIKNPNAEEFLNNAEYRAAVESGSGVAARMEAVAEALRNEANK